MYISDLAEAVDLPVSTIRFYERQRLLTEMHFTRQHNNYRIYNDAAVERIELIKAAQQAGITLQEMRIYIDEWEANSLSDDQKCRFFSEKLAEIERRILGLQRMRQYVLKKLDNLKDISTEA